MTQRKEKVETGWNFDHSYARLPELFFQSSDPEPAHAPRLIIANDRLADYLGLNTEWLHSEEGKEVLAGNIVPDSAFPLAQAYAGHQFGHFTMLGDGRALLLGEQITPQDERVDIQLKGSGRTPYSRGGDGRAPLGPMLREYIISEAMHALGIPTNRSLAVVATGESVIRESEQPGAVLTRVASSHLRVGTFQFAARWGTLEDLRALADYTVHRHFPTIESDENRYLSLLQQVIERQAKLIAKWQMIGFIHGVMNTDNMAISGETIDYGPCAFMNTYDPATVFSSIDIQGRYAYGNQPDIAGWNLVRFAETLIPLIHENQDEAIKIAERELSHFTSLYEANWLDGMRRKLGIFNQETEDKELAEDLLRMMKEYKADFTNTFRALTFDRLEDISIFEAPEFKKWLEQWRNRLDRQEESKDTSYQLMKNNNPAIIPRNHRVEEAIEAAVKEEDFSVLEQLLGVLSNPYAHSCEQEAYTAPPEPTSRPYRTFCGT
ncbi:protein adenylyltransferase SelO [Halobacillus sp. B29]|uniref:protein adenylyltransferase SelO n=1 Tax=Halobacillus sp. B29 TaxID=3457432 RepID=UPI003FCE86E0